MTRSRIVILNGVGSVGKTSIARALQNITSTPFLHVMMDVFIDMLPELYQNHPQGFSYQRTFTKGVPQVEVHTGEVGERLLTGMRNAMGGLADAGNNLVVDDVIFGNPRQQYQALLKRHEVSVVGVFADLPVLEERERARGDRMVGLARWEFDRVHVDREYDLEIDTTFASPLECASLIKEQFNL